MTPFAVSTILQVIVGLGLLNVWLVRARTATAYRGGSAQSLKEEFATYGLPDWTFYAVGALKVGSAVLLIAGIWLPPLIRPPALVVAALMVGALDSGNVASCEIWTRSVSSSFSDGFGVGFMTPLR